MFYLRCKNTTLWNRRCFFASSSFFPPLRWQIRNPPRPYSCSCVATTLPSRAGDSVWPASSSFYRQRGDIRQFRRPSSPQSGQTEWCAPPDGGRGKTGGGENSAVAGDVPAAARLRIQELHVAHQVEFFWTVVTNFYQRPREQFGCFVYFNDFVFHIFQLLLFVIALFFSGTAAPPPDPRECRGLRCDNNLAGTFSGIPRCCSALTSRIRADIICSSSCDWLLVISEQ